MHTLRDEETGDADDPPEALEEGAVDAQAGLGAVGELVADVGGRREAGGGVARGGAEDVAELGLDDILGEGHRLDHSPICITMGADSSSMEYTAGSKLEQWLPQQNNAWSAAAAPCRLGP